MSSSPSGWSGVNAGNTIVDEKGFPRVNLGAIYDVAKRGLTEDSYNAAADAGFGAMRAGPYVASLNQNLGTLQGQMAGKAADLSEAEAGRRLSDLMQSRGIASQEKMQTAELGSRASLQEAQLAAAKANLGMELSSREKLALAQLGEEGRQYDVGMGQRASEFGSNLAFQQQQAEDQRYQQWLNFLFGGAQSFTQPTGRTVPNGAMTPTTPSPFSQVLGPILQGGSMAAGNALFG